MYDGTLRGRLSFNPPQRGETDYDEIYEVTPSVEEQMLKTEGKLLSKNILIHAIPYSETTNKSDGITVYIATKEA